MIGILRKLADRGRKYVHKYVAETAGATAGGLELSHTLNTNSAYVTITNAAHSADATYTIPAAGTASFVLTEGAQTIAGIKTLTNQLIRSNGTVAAVGTNQATAAAVSKDTTTVTASDNAKGVVLPTAVAGMTIVLKNTVADKSLKVYPATGAAIDAAGANAAVIVPAGGLVKFVATSATQWYSDLTPTAATLAGAGSAAGDAAQIVARITAVTGADGAVGVKLPAVAGGMFIVKNTVAGQALKVYPPTGGDISGTGTDAALSVAGGKAVVFFSTTTTQWYHVLTA